MIHPRLAVCSALLVALSLAACGDGDSTTSNGDLSDAEDVRSEQAPDRTEGEVGAEVEPDDRVVTTPPLAPEPSAAEASTTTASDTTEATSPPDTTIAAGIGWERVPSDDEVFDGEGRQSINAVTIGGPGFVAVGVDDTAGAAWTSIDGLAWSRSRDDAGVFSGESRHELNSIAAGGPGLVAVGIDGIGGAVWTSPDGETWSRASDPGLVLGGSQEIHGIVAADPGLVAVGSAFDIAGSNATIWTSPDGTNWTRQLIPKTDPAEVHATMNAVIVGGPGLIAVGFISTGGDEDAAVWTSPDGVTWTRVPHDEAVFGGPDGQTMEAVTVGGPGLVAVGQDYNGDGVGAAVWTSPDGLAWTKVPSNQDTFGGSQARGMWGVIADGSGLVAVGAVSSGSAIWTSPDGSVWTWVPQNQGAFDKDGGVIHGITATASRLVAVGQDYSSSDAYATVWVKDTSG